MWKNDTFGLVFKSNEVKLYKDGHHTWAMKLSQLGRQKGIVRIVTYSLPRIEYAKEQLGRRPYDIFIVCHTKFKRQALAIKRAFPSIRVATIPDVHSKVCLIEPRTVYIGSANFGNSGWHESIVGIRSQAAHDWYVLNSFDPLWLRCKEIQ